MAKPAFDIVTVGDCKADYFVRLSDYEIVPATATKTARLQLRFGEKLIVPEFSLFPGGNPLNAAVALSRLGLRVGMYAVLGKDPEGQKILEKMQEEKIATKLLDAVSSTQTDKSIILVARGERTILGRIFPKSYRPPGQMQTRWLYLTSLGEKFKNVYDWAAGLSRSGKTKIVFNPGTWQLIHALPAVRAMVGRSEIVVMNVEEAQKVTKFNSRDSKKLLSASRRLGANIAVVTDGPLGACGYDGRNYYRIASYPATRVDATGAGDAFAASLAAAIFYGHGLAEALRWGSVNAACEIGQIGVQNGLQKKSSLALLLKRHPKFKAKKF